MVKTKLTIEGPNVVARTYSIDTTKPKCWVEGSTYRFNSELIRTITMQKSKVAKLMEEQTEIKTRERVINEWIEYLNRTDPAKLEEPAQGTAREPYTERSQERTNNRNEESSRSRQE